MIIENHLFLSMAKDIDAICKPLKSFGIHLFSFRRTFKNGSRVNISNDSDWLFDYYQLKLYESSLFEYSIDHYDSGFSLWPQESSLPVFAHGRKYFNSDNGITLVLKYNDYCDFFMFGADYKNKQIVNMYINNLDLIKNFTDHFYLESDLLLKKALPHTITITPRLNDDNNIFYKKMDPVSLKALFPKLLKEDVRTMTLSAREKSCVEYLILGMTAKEIGRKLNLSYRTIEYYIENIKQKTSCRNKYEIIKLFS